MKLIFSCIFAMMMPLSILATNIDDGNSSGNRFAIEAASSVDINTWRLEMAYHYMIQKFCGIGVSFGTMEEYTGNNNIPNGKGWRIDDNSRKVSHIYICPSVHLTMPGIVKIFNSKIGLFAEPGLRLFIPFSMVMIEKYHKSGGYIIGYDLVKSCSGKWAYMNIKFGVSVHTIHGICFSLGYNYSQMDVYYLRRNMNYKSENFNKFYPPEKSIKELTISVSCTF